MEAEGHYYVVDDCADVNCNVQDKDDDEEPA